jgi:N-acetylneuraminate lyase
MNKDIKGLIAAAFTPLNCDGTLNLLKIADVGKYILDSEIDGIYVCGSTGEGPLLSTGERKQVAESYVSALSGRLPVIVHVGHESIPEARSLAKHAHSIGVDAIAAIGPIYFKVDSAETLIKYLAQIASSAAELPFYYYHIPALSGISLDMVDFLRKADKQIPTLAGIKYTDEKVNEFQECKETFGPRYRMFFGRDEMMASGLCAGADGVIGSTYNFASSLYRQIMESFSKGDMETVRKLQNKSIQMIRTLFRYGGQPAFKSVMKLIGLNCGPSRLPLISLKSEDIEQLRKELKELGLEEWIPIE